MKRALLRRVVDRLRGVRDRVLGRVAEAIHPTNKSGNNASVR